MSALNNKFTAEATPLDNESDEFKKLQHYYHQSIQGLPALMMFPELAIAQRLWKIYFGPRAKRRWKLLRRLN
jgi:hypothetical protein